MADDRLLNAALAYAAHGWPVFPLAPRSKVPRKGSHGFQDATTDLDQIRRWWNSDLNANIGVPTGARSGLAVLDVDPRHGGDVALEALTAKHGPLPETLEQITGGGGRHYCFRHDPAFGNGNRKFGPGLDAKGDGGYVLVAPSVHPDGPAYAWEGGDGPEAAAVAPLPAWLAGNGPVLLNPDGTGNLNFDAATVAARADGSPADPGSRNNTLTQLAGQWIAAGDSYATAHTKALEWNATNAVPLSVDEVERTVKSVIRTHKRKNPAAHVAVVDPPAQAGAAAPDAGGPTAQDGPSVASQPTVDGPPAAIGFPPHLLAVPGFVGEICGWINATAYKPQPVLALANALAFFGAVVGRKVRTASNLRTNLYCLGVGDSGSGKDHSRRCVKAICEAAGITADLLGGEEVSSDTAITAALFEHPSLLFQFDEVGHFLSQANSKYAQSHQRNIAPTFTKLFSSAGTTFLGKAMASKKRQDIDQPNCCLYGTTVPGRLYEGMTPAEITDGFLGRMLVFKSDDPDPQERDVEFAPVPDAIVSMVQAWFARKMLVPANAGNLFRPQPITVPFDDEATGHVKRFAARCREMKTAHRADRRGMDALWARGVEHATKLALTVACGVDFQQPVVTGDVAAWAVALVDHVTVDLVETVHDSIAGSDFERELLYVRRAIRAAGTAGLTTTQLSQKTQRIKPQLRTEILNQLVTAGSVVKGEYKPARGPSAAIYHAAGMKP